MMTQNIKRKNKKKKSFLQRMKKKGRSGDFGDGVSEQEYSYHMHILKSFQTGDDQEKELLIKNFYESMREEEVKSLAKSRIVSKILDETLHLADQRYVLKILKVISEDLRVFCTDPFASHVVQTLLGLSLRNIQKKKPRLKGKGDDTEAAEHDSEGEGHEEERFLEFITKSTKFVFNNLSEFVGETYASHVVRSVLEVCFGIELSADLKCGKNSHLVHSIGEDAKTVFEVPAELREMGLKMAARLMQIPDFVGVIGETCGSAVMQSALTALSAAGETEEVGRMLDHILSNGFEPLGGEGAPAVHPVFETSATSRLMDVVVGVASPVAQKEIFDVYMRESLEHLVVHPFGNHAVQKVLAAWKSKESFDNVFEAVTPHLGAALEEGMTGVVLSYVQACRRLRTRASSCLRNLMSLLEAGDECFPSGKAALLVLHLLPRSKYDSLQSSGGSAPIALHGALLLEELLQFPKPIKVVEGVMALPPADLERVAKDPRGSHVVDAFVRSPFVGEANKRKLIAKLEGSASDLAVSRHGSRSLEALWGVADVKGRTRICQQLYAARDKLRDNQFGTIVYNKFQVRFFHQEERKDWEQIQEKELKKRKLLREMLLRETGDDDDAPLGLPPHKRTKLPPRE